MVKRVGNLMPLICSLENLHEAFLRAAKGKGTRSAVVAFRQRLDDNLTDMSRQLAEGSFQFGQYHFFTVYDPKRRTICAASFPERVAFHAIMRICHPVFDDFQIYDSYASRVGRGQYKALERARHFCHRYKWFAKMDVRKYFDSISHEVLYAQLCRLFKDPLLLDYFRQLIDGYEVKPGEGVPIGNLTSQYFANHYLAVADHYAKEQLRIKAMVRYMDDVVLFDDDPVLLKAHVSDMTEYIGHRLRLSLHEPVVNSTRFGIPFLGYVVYPDRLRLNGRSRRRFVHKMAALTFDLGQGMIDERQYAMRAGCLMAFIDKADVCSFKRKMCDTKGLYPNGL